MSHEGAAARRWALQDALTNAKVARAALRAGDLSRAISAWGLGLRSLYYVRGIVAHRGWNAMTATCGLYRVLTVLGEQIEAAAKPMIVEQAEAVDLVPPLFESLKVLQRRGVEVDDELLLDRARNAATSLTADFTFTPIPTAGRN